MPRVIHFEIHADEPERAIRFYSSVFGWEFVKFPNAITDYWVVKTGDASQDLTDWQKKIAVLIHRLTDDVPVDVAERTAEQHARWLLAYVLDWHRREDKAAWWEYFRLCDLSADLFGRVRSQAERLQPLVDRLVVRAVILLVRLDVAVRLPLADDDHDLLVLDIGAARNREILRDPLVACGRFARSTVVRRREPEPLGQRGAGGNGRQQQKQGTGAYASHDGSRARGVAR